MIWYKQSRKIRTTFEFIDQENEGVVVVSSWRDLSSPNIASLECYPPSRKNLSAENVREKLCKCFNGPGQIPWQWDEVNSFAIQTVKINEYNQNKLCNFLHLSFTN